MGFDTRPVQEYPFVDRNHQQMAGLLTGVTPPVVALDLNRDPNRNRFFSTNGQPTYLNQFYVEGVINQEPVRGTSIRVIPEEAIEQTGIVTANPIMERGFGAGAYFVDSIRAGTNGFHGSLFERWSGSALRTRSFFDTLNSESSRFNYRTSSERPPVARWCSRSHLHLRLLGRHVRSRTADIACHRAAARYAEWKFQRGPRTQHLLAFHRQRKRSRSGRLLSERSHSDAVAEFHRGRHRPLPARAQPAGLVEQLLATTPYENDYQKADGRIDRFTRKTSMFLRYGYSNHHTLMNSGLAR